MKYPANKEKFREVLVFAKQILDICNKIDIQPLVYGSLACFAHTEDVTLPVNDIDFLVPEASFDDLMKELDGLEGVRYEKMPYHSIECFKGDIEIDLDSIEHFLDPRPRDSVSFEIDGLTFSIVNKDTLADIYQEALDNMPDERHLDEKRAKYQRKLDNLRNL
jgi:hypothetical protein